MNRICLFLLLGLLLFGAVGLWSGGEEAEVFASVHTSEDTVFVLDAGHGGEDGGAGSESGIRESDINLSVVLRTEQLLAFCGSCPVLTRREDISIHDAGAVTLREKKVSDLKNRARLVESVDNAVLISVHQNSFTDAAYSGAQVFYSSGDPVRIWAEAAQQQLRIFLDPDNSRTAKPIPDGIYLFSHITCPALLVECGFLSNREEAAQLENDDYQKKISAVLAGICLQAGRYGISG